MTARCVRPERKAQRWPVLSIDEEGTFRPHSMSVAEFGAEDFLRPLRQVRLCFERREERQVPIPPDVRRDPIADQLEGRPGPARSGNQYFDINCSLDRQSQSSAA